MEIFQLAQADYYHIKILLIIILNIFTTKL